MSNIQTIREQRSNIVNDMRAMTNQAQAEQRDFSKDESTRFDVMKGQLKSVEGQLSRAEVIADAERSMAAHPSHRSFGLDSSFEQQCRDFSITKAIANHLEPGSVDAGREVEVSQELARRNGVSPAGLLVPHDVFLEKRDVLTSGSGGNLVPDTHRPDLFIDRLRSSLNIQQLGATVLSGLQGNQSIPRLTGSATGYWVAEHGNVTESDHTFDEVTMTPKTVGAEVEYSRRMLINASPSVEQLVRNDLARVLATAIESAAINSDGTGNRPTGIMQSGIGEVELGDPDGGAPTWDKILEIIATVEDNDALSLMANSPEELINSSYGFLTNPQAVKKMRSTNQINLTDAELNTFLMTSPFSLANYKCRSTTLVPKTLTKGTGTDLSALIFGNWSDLLVGYWSSVDLLINPYHSDVYSKGGVKINALQDVDIAVRHPESFCMANDMVTS